MVGAMRPGNMSTAVMVAIVSHMIGHAQSFSFSASNLAATANATMPAATPPSWRTRK
jgi:hypothetical protein